MYTGGGGVSYSLAEESLGERHGRDEDASIEGGIALVADIEVEDELPGPREDGCDGNRL